LPPSPAEADKALPVSRRFPVSNRQGMGEGWGGGGQDTVTSAETGGENRGTDTY